MKDYDWREHDKYNEYIRPLIESARQMVDEGRAPEVMRHAIENIDRYDLAWRLDFYGSRGYIVDSNGYPVRDKAIQ